MYSCYGRGLAEQRLYCRVVFILGPDVFAVFTEAKFLLMREFTRLNQSPSMNFGVGPVFLLAQIVERQKLHQCVSPSCAFVHTQKIRAVSYFPVAGFRAETQPELWARL